MASSAQYQHHGLLMVLVFSLLAHSLLIFWLKDDNWFSKQTVQSQAHPTLSFSIAQTNQTEAESSAEPPVQQPSPAIQKSSLESDAKIPVQSVMPEAPVKPKPIKTVQQKPITDSQIKPHKEINKNNILEKQINITSQSSTVSTITKTVNQSENRSKTQAAEKSNYLQMLMQQVEKKKFYPRSARRRHIEGQIVVNLLINQEGFVIDVRLEEGHKLLKQATRKAILEAQPFTPPPVSIDITQALRFVIAYQLK